MPNVLMPQMGESVTEGTIVRWMKRVGDAVDKDEPLFEISTDKVDAEIPSPDAGVLAQILVAEGDTVPVHTVVAIIAATARSTADQGVPPAAASDSGIAAPVAGAAPAVQGEGVASASRGALDGPGAALPPTKRDGPSRFLSPVVRKMAAVHGLDLSTLTGSGTGGRVTRRDVDALLAAKASPAASRRPSLYQPGDDVRVEKMSVMRRKIADHMLASLRTSAHIYSAYEIDFSRVSALREAHKARYAAEGLNLTYTAFIAWAIAATLREFPYVNASLDEDEIVVRNDINIGIAVALDQGLIVPVIHHADRANLKELCATIADLAQRARQKQLKVDDVESGTFTITNPGIFGGLWGLPIINQPQVAILAVGSIDKRAVVVDDRIEIRPMSHFVLAYDHRLVDGADGGRFLQAVKARIERFDEALL
jgi:pyruvate dehydrogenase E2 component (dihydrolipoamide acetyltransferase)